MPVPNVSDATKEIKSLQPELPVIAQTAYTSEADRKHAFQFGFQEFLSKPINKESLFEAIEKYHLKN